jgi:hypothetical protein
MTTDDRIRAAFEAQANQVGEQDLRPAGPPLTETVLHQRHRIRWTAPLLAAAAVIAVVVGTAIAVSGGGNSAEHKITPGGTSGSVISPSATNTLDSQTPVSTTVSAGTPQTAPAGTAACFFADFGSACSGVSSFYEPLWPFKDWNAAKQWAAVDGPAGHQPWHADPKATALSFASGYLGFSDITEVTTTKIDANEAHIGVGYINPAGAPHTAAVIHLVRYEATVGDTTAGWEVVGTDDTTFSIEQPAYNSKVTSPMTVAGHITGVDENIVVSVKSLGGGTDALPGLPAGGDNSPWSETVPFSETGVLTVVAFTGGHVTQHELFAVQGVHT